MTNEGDLSSALGLNTRKILYPLSPYPQILDLWIALKRLQLGEQWTGQEFFAYTDAPHRPDEVTEYYFWHRVNGIIFGFSTEEWRQLGKIFDRFFTLPDLDSIRGCLAYFSPLFIGAVFSTFPQTSYYHSLSESQRGKISQTSKSPKSRGGLRKMGFPDSFHGSDLHGFLVLFWRVTFILSRASRILLLMITRYRDKSFL